MRNLAGNKRATEVVSRELARVGVPEEPCEPCGEVASAVSGRLGEFTFKRAWRYYAVAGRVPLATALALYEDPVGKTDIRVAGHCGCPPPEFPWLGSFNPKTGKKIEDRKGQEEYEGFVARGALPAGEFEKTCEWGDPEDGEKFVTGYHVDSELGLFKLVQAIRQAGLVEPCSACS